MKNICPGLECAELYLHTHIRLHGVVHMHIVNVIQTDSSPTCRQTFTKPGSTELLHAGDIMVNPRLGRTLRVVAKQGAHSLYSGTLAESLVYDVRSAGGLLARSDLATYK